MEHKNQRNAFAFVAFGLNHRGDADLCVAADFGDARQCARDIDNIETHKIPGEDVSYRDHCALAFVGNEGWDAVLGSKFQVERSIGEITHSSLHLLRLSAVRICFWL